jgi:hypothetical protein
VGGNKEGDEVMTTLRPAVGICAAVLAVALVASPARASDQADAFAVVQRFNDAWNRGDTAAAAGNFAPSISIIDDAPPYLWQGPGALQQWDDDIRRLLAKNPSDETSMNLSEPEQALLQDDGIYLVIPGALQFRRKGVSGQHRGILTVTLKKTGQAWLIGSFAWSRLKAEQ